MTAADYFFAVFLVFLLGAAVGVALMVLVIAWVEDDDR